MRERFSGSLMEKEEVALWTVKKSTVAERTEQCAWGPKCCVWAVQGSMEEKQVVGRQRSQLRRFRSSDSVQ